VTTKNVFVQKLGAIFAWIFDKSNFWGRLCTPVSYTTVSNCKENFQIVVNEQNNLSGPTKSVAISKVTI